MKKFFLLILMVLCVFTVEFFQDSAHSQMAMQTPDFATAARNNSFAAYEVQFTPGQQEIQRKVLTDKLADGNRQDDLYEDFRKAIRAGVLEIDQNSMNVFYFGGMKAPVHHLFPISGLPEIEFNKEEETGYYSGIRHDDQAAHFTMVGNTDIRLYPLNKAYSDDDETVLYFFAQDPSVWIDLIYDMTQQFPEMTFTKKSIDQVYPFTKYSMIAADHVRNRNTFGSLSALAATALLAVTVFKGKGCAEKKWNTFLSLSIPSMFLVPGVIVILSRLDHIVWNSYTTFYYNDLFRFCGLMMAGFALVGVITVLYSYRKNKH